MSDKAMTNKEVNRYIHTEIMGVCPCEFEQGHVRYTGSLECSKCGNKNCNYILKNIPDYCSDNSPRSLLMDVCKELDHDTLERAILDEIRGVTDCVVSFSDGSAGISAHYIARACVKAHQEQSK